MNFIFALTLVLLVSNINTQHHKDAFMAFKVCGETTSVSAIDAMSLFGDGIVNEWVAKFVDCLLKYTNVLGTDNKIHIEKLDAYAEMLTNDCAANKTKYSCKKINDLKSIRKCLVDGRPDDTSIWPIGSALAKCLVFKHIKKSDQTPLNLGRDEF